MDLRSLSVAEIVAQFGRNAQDTGYDSVQIALLTKRIQGLSHHFQVHKKDNASRRGLLKIVSQRKSLLKHLRDKNFDQFSELVKTLQIRTGSL